MLKRLISLLRVFTVKRVVALLFLLLGASALVIAYFVANSSVPVLSTGGMVADKERDLIVFTVLLGMAVVIPVFILLFSFAWRYRVGNTKRKAKYTPDAKDNRIMEVIWWGIPILIIGILGVVTWVSTHDLDPFKKIESDKNPITIDVVALEWKWLFIYPESGIASINEVRFPENTPITFKITADAPMSAFWIPKLGSQIYAMKGMTTQLNLIAHDSETYFGTNTNINGTGYAKMTFSAISMSDADFNQWVNQRQSSDDERLDWNAYKALVNQSTDNPVTYFALAEPQLLQKIVDQYMAQESTDSQSGDHSHGMMEQMEGM